MCCTLAFDSSYATSTAYNHWKAKALEKIFTVQPHTNYIVI